MKSVFLFFFFFIFMYVFLISVNDATIHTAPQAEDKFWEIALFTPLCHPPLPKIPAQVSCVSCIVRWILYHWATWGSWKYWQILLIPPPKWSSVSLFVFLSSANVVIQAIAGLLCGQSLASGLLIYTLVLNTQLPIAFKTQSSRGHFF